MPRLHRVQLVAVCVAIACLSLVPGVCAEDDPLRPAAVETADVPVVPREFVERLRRYRNVREAGFRGWAPDGNGMLVETRFGNTAQLHRVHEPGGRRDQITFFDEAATGEFVPRSKVGALVVSLSSGGNEDLQLYRVNPSGGEAAPLTDGKSRNLLQTFAPDGSRMIVASNARNGRDTDLYIVDLRDESRSRPESSRAAGTLELLFPRDGEYWTAADWSPVGNALLIDRFVSVNESHPALLTWEERSSNANGSGAGSTRFSTNLRPLPVPGDEVAAFGPMKFAPDGQHAYVTTDAESEFLRLAKVDLETFEYEWITADIPWNVEALVVEPRSGLVAFAVNREGTSDLYLYDGKQVAKQKLPEGIIADLDFSPDGESLGFTLSPPTAPADAWSLAVPTGKLTRWTHSEVGGLDRETFVAPRIVRFETFDGREVTAWYAQPRKATADRPVPVVVDIHGGPQGQSRPFFAPMEQFFLNELGFAIVRPNVRGSGGFGKTFLKLDNAEKREDSVKDIGALLDWIARQPELDSKRLAVTGRSYGGYMVLASMQHYPERIQAGVDVVGVASFTTFLEHTREYRRDLRRQEYGDERDPKMRAVFERINPTNRTHLLKGELFIAHGRNDPRVPFEVAEEIVAKVRENGLRPWTFYAADEGHVFMKKANKDYLDAVTALFLATQLK